MALFRKKIPAPRQDINDPPASGLARRVPVAGPAPVSAMAGSNPYDTAAPTPRKARGVRRDGAHPTTTQSDDPYGTADRRPRQRSWDDAFIDTWVEHKRKPRD